VSASDIPKDAPPGGQLPLFPGLTGSRLEEAPPGDLTDASIAETPADSRQIELFADHVVLARELDLAISAGRFEEAARIRLVMDEVFGPSDLSRSAALLDALAAAAWEGPPALPLSTWAEIDRQLVDQPSLRGRVQRGAFTRLLQTHTPAELLTARPECLPILVRALGFGPGRSPEEARVEARGLVRDSLLSGRTLDALDFREDAALADLLAENLPSRWLACLGRIRRLWTTSPPRESEWEALRGIAAGESAHEEPALAFWQCLCLAESPDCPDDLRHQARRRMKQLHPELHALYMRHPSAG
jgi:hypothetical protein